MYPFVIRKPAWFVHAMLKLFALYAHTALVSSVVCAHLEMLNSHISQGTPSGSSCTK